MAVTLIAEQQGTVTTFTATSDLTTPIFHWWADGVYLGASTGRVWHIPILDDDLIDVACVDTEDPDFDPHDPENNPQPYPARRTLYWIRSLSADTSYYLVEQKKGEEEYAAIAEVEHVASRWVYSLRTGRLDDLSDYTWRITPYDGVGNAGAATTIGPERIVRRPDPPEFVVAFHSPAATVTISEAP